MLVNIHENDYRGVALGKWVAQLRAYKKSGEGRVYLTSERVAALEAIGMVWDVPDYYWEQNYRAAEAYYKAHGNLKMAHDYEDENGIRIGTWLSKMRNLRTGTNYQGTELTEEQIKRLETIGMQWETRYDDAWKRNFEAVRHYKERNGHLNIPATYVSEEGLCIGRWLRNQRDSFKAGTLSVERKEKLIALGMVFEKEEPWEHKFKLLRAYYEEHGDLNIKSNYVVDGIWLCKWLEEQVARLNGKATSRSRTTKVLTQKQIEKLEMIGIKRMKG